MRVLRTTILMVVCLGLALPSSHALALCIDSDGSLALEVAVDGACTGAKTQGRDAARTQTHGFGFAVDTVVVCDGCKDVVIRGSSVATPPTSTSEKSRPSRATDEAVAPVDATSGLRRSGLAGAARSSSAAVQELPVPCDSVVLRL
jgi:hypothetical protein